MSSDDRRGLSELRKPGLSKRAQKVCKGDVSCLLKDGKALGRGERMAGNVSGLGKGQLEGY